MVVFFIFTPFFVFCFLYYNYFLLFFYCQFYCATFPCLLFLTFLSFNITLFFILIIFIVQHLLPPSFSLFRTLMLNFYRPPCPQKIKNKIFSYLISPFFSFFSFFSHIRTITQPTSTRHQRLEEKSNIVNILLRVIRLWGSHKKEV